MSVSSASSSSCEDIPCREKELDLDEEFRLYRGVINHGLEIQKLKSERPECYKQRVCIGFTVWFIMMIVVPVCCLCGFVQCFFSELWYNDRPWAGESFNTGDRVNFFSKETGSFWVCVCLYLSEYLYIVCMSWVMLKI